MLFKKDKFKKLSSIVYTQIPITREVYYNDKLENMLENFINSLMELVFLDTNQHNLQNKFIGWTNIFLFPIIKLNSDNLHKLLNVYLSDDEDFINKFKKLYLDIGCTISISFINNLKFNFYRHLKDVNNLSVEDINFINEEYPYLFLISISSNKWWEKTKQHSHLLQDAAFFK